MQVPYLSTEKIQEQAELTRAQYLDVNSKLPIDAELLAEKIGLELWPVEDLLSQAGIDALVIHPLKAIMVDKGEYNDESSWNRLRFTIAHEIGHFVMHRHILDQAKFSSIIEWKELIKNLDHYDRIEIQAHEFAGRLIVPKDRLILSIQQHKVKLKEASPEDFLQRLALRISRDFFVSEDLILVRFDRENLSDLIYSGR